MHTEEGSKVGSLITAAQQSHAHAHAQEQEAALNGEMAPSVPRSWPTYHTYANTKNIQMSTCENTKIKAQKHSTKPGLSEKTITP